MPIKISVPCSKSIANRALILSSLSNEPVILQNFSLCDDTFYMVEALKKLGIKIIPHESGIKIFGNNACFKRRNEVIHLYAGNAGTTARFLTALATLTNNQIFLDGESRMKERPMKILIDTLQELGAKIKSSDSHLPFHISDSVLKGGDVFIQGDISSQYISALLLVLPFASEESSITIEQKLCSKSYVKITLDIMKRFGLKVENLNFTKFIVPPKQKIVAPESYIIESDASSASYIGGFAAIHPQKEILLENIFEDSIQGDIKFLKYLEQMGCEIKKHERGTIITGPAVLKSLGEINMNDTPDLVMTFATLALFTDGETLITDISNLRIKESDRIKAMETELKKLGADVSSGEDFIKICGKKNIDEYEKNVEIKTYNDHRVAMSFGVIKDFFPGMHIENPNCVSKSYTTFWDDLEKLRKS
jgi:3-phosphoshikimate 1-carboxyvinyltransferase